MERLMHQHSAADTLTRLLSGGRFPHVLIIEGAEGSGKKTLAKTAASMLLCTGRTSPCGSCPACIKAAAGIHPDIKTVDGTAKKAYAVDVVRDLRLEGYRVPEEGERRVFVLTDAQNMSVASQNVLLKIIEEPPKHLFFILTTTSRGALLETVLSRAALISLRELTASERLEILKAKRPELPQSDLAAAAEAYQTVGQALVSLESDGDNAPKAASRLFESAVMRDKYAILTELCAFERDRDGFARTLGHLRTLFINRLTAGDAPYSALQCARIVDIIEKAQHSAVQNVGLALVSVVLSDGLIAALGVQNAPNSPNYPGRK